MIGTGRDSAADFVGVVLWVSWRRVNEHVAISMTMSTVDRTVRMGSWARLHKPPSMVLGVLNRLANVLVLVSHFCLVNLAERVDDALLLPCHK